MLFIPVTAMVALCALPAGAAGTRVNETKYGFSFSLPAKWVSIPLNGVDISKILGKATKADPALKKGLTKEVKQAAKNAIKFFAVGPISNAFASNINIIVESSAGLPTGSSYFSLIEPQIKAQLTKDGFEGLQTAVVQLAMGKEITATYHLPTGVAGEFAQGFQLYVRHKSHVEIITFTSSAQSIDHRAATVRRQLAVALIRGERKQVGRRFAFAAWSHQ